MRSVDCTDWPVSELRLAYFDFTVRGEGDGTVVAGVMQQCLARELITAEIAGFWEDAIAWRAIGGVLPGWAVPAECLGAHAPGTGSDDDQRLFEAWRKQRKTRRPPTRETPLSIAS